MTATAVMIVTAGPQCKAELDRLYQGMSGATNAPPVVLPPTNQGPCRIIRTDKPAYFPGETIQVSYTNMPAAGSWVGLGRDSSNADQYDGANSFSISSSMRPASSIGKLRTQDLTPRAEPYYIRLFDSANHRMDECSFQFGPVTVDIDRSKRR
ncbi:MAG: hypothetical protein HYZ37_00115 [Candidatus Solibacter usitatus]|nr:hypothetical protein [Candidatus Solibacter usitatus]